MHRNIFTLYLLILTIPSYSQSNSSAVYNGLAGVNAISEGVWSVRGNQAGLASVKNPIGGVTYSNRFIKYKIYSIGFSVAMPVFTGTFGLDVNQLRFDSYTNRDYALSYGMNLTKYMKAGIAVVYKRISLGEYYGSVGSVYVSAGSILNISNRVILGIHFYNPTQSTLNYQRNEQLPALASLAVKYKLGDNINVYGQFDIELKHKYIWHIALDYIPVKNLVVRGGIRTTPVNYSIGVGYRLKRIVTDAAFVIHPVLGVYPELSVSISGL
jgi:hypothetical protein